MRMSISLLLFLAISFASCAQTKKDIHLKKESILGNWKAKRNEYMTVSGLEDAKITEYNRQIVKIDSVETDIYSVFYKNPTFSIERVNTKESLSRNFTFDADVFGIKTEYLYEIWLSSFDQSFDQSKGMYEKRELLLYDGNHLYVVRNGVVFVLSKREKAVSRSTR